MKILKSFSRLIIALLLIEFLDEFIFGIREAAWPYIRTDLNLTYIQIGLILAVPNYASSLLEPIIGILGDIWKRRVLILGGGIVFAGALALVASSQNFWFLLLAFGLYYPATGAFVSLSQAALMDSDPQNHEKNMARWTFWGSLGIVIGPLVLVLADSIGWGWRQLFWISAGLTLLSVGVVWRLPVQPNSRLQKPSEEPFLRQFWQGVLQAATAFTRKDVLRWLSILAVADLMLDVFHAYLALYFVDVAGFDPRLAGMGVAVWTGCGLLGDFFLIPLLEKVAGLRYLRLSALLVGMIFPLFLLIPGVGVKIALAGLLGLLNAGWYAIPKGQLYSTLPEQSGIVMTVSNLFNIVAGSMPLALGWVAQNFGLPQAMWILWLSPLILVFGIHTVHSKISSEENNSNGKNIKNSRGG